MFDVKLRFFLQRRKNIFKDLIKLNRKILFCFSTRNRLVRFRNTLIWTVAQWWLQVNRRLLIGVTPSTYSVSSKSSDFLLIWCLDFSCVPNTLIGIPMMPNGGNPIRIFKFNFPSKLVCPSNRNLKPATLNLKRSMVTMLF